MRRCIVDSRETTKRACTGAEIVGWIFGTETKFDCMALKYQNRHTIDERVALGLKGKEGS